MVRESDTALVHDMQILPFGGAVLLYLCMQKLKIVRFAGRGGGVKISEVFSVLYSLNLFCF